MNKSKLFKAHIATDDKYWNSNQTKTRYFLKKMEFICVAVPVPAPVCVCVPKAVSNDSQPLDLVVLQVYYIRLNRWAIIYIVVKYNLRTNWCYNLAESKFCLIGVGRKCIAIERTQPKENDI